MERKRTMSFEKEEELELTYLLLQAAGIEKPVDCTIDWENVDLNPGITIMTPEEDRKPKVYEKKGK